MLEQYIISKYIWNLMNNNKKTLRITKSIWYLYMDGSPRFYLRFYFLPQYMIIILNPRNLEPKGGV
jgi:hypothetical protein